MLSTEIKTMYSKLLYIITLHTHLIQNALSFCHKKMLRIITLKKLAPTLSHQYDWVSAVKCNTCFSHDVAEIAGLTAQSFGVEGVDRYIILFKKECPPSEDELATLRDGDEWNEEKAKELAQKVSKLYVGFQSFVKKLEILELVQELQNLNR